MLLLVGSLRPSNPTLAGPDMILKGELPVRGFTKITRHPMLWGIGLWAVSHLLANGDQASLILFGGMAILAFGGMAHIDARRRASLGAAWGPVALTTSVVPFLAAIQGRTRIDWAGIGLARVAGGLAVYAAFLLTHGWATGVDILGR